MSSSNQSQDSVAEEQEFTQVTYLKPRKIQESSDLKPAKPVKPEVDQVVHRKKGYFADVSICFSQITRNEVLDNVKFLRGKSTFQYEVDVFDKSTYDLIDHLENKMSEKMREDFLAKKAFELVIHDSSLNATGTEPTVLDQLYLFGDMLKEIKHISIKIVVPADAATDLTKRQFSATKPAAFLRQVAKEINDMTSLKSIEIVLNIPENTEVSAYQHHVFPFYHLNHMPVWVVKYHSGKQDRKFLSRALLNKPKEVKVSAPAAPADVEWDKWITVRPAKVKKGRKGTS